MRALALLLALAGCDRVFGLGDPYEDAATTSHDGASDGKPTDGGGDDAPSSSLLVYFPLDGNLHEADSRADATCTGTCGFGPAHTNAGQALVMNGLTCMSFTMADQPTTLTVAMWADPTTGASATLLDRPYRTASALPPVWQLDEDNDSIQWTTYDGGAPSITSAGHANAFLAGVWHHVAIVTTPLKREIYIDGVSQSSVDGATIAYSDGNIVYIGCGPAGGSDPQFSGSVDEIRIYGAALTQQDISALAQ